MLKHDVAPKFVDYYLKVHMPQDNIACKYCPCIKYDNDSNSRRCKLTWEILAYPDVSLGKYCMLIKPEEDYKHESDSQEQE